MEPTQKLEQLQKKVKEIDNKRIGAEKELELLNKQHKELVKEIQDNGIEDINNLPTLIKELEEEIDLKLQQAEEQIRNAESSIT